MKVRIPQILCMGTKLLNKKVWEIEDKKDEENFRKIVFQKKNRRIIKKRKIIFKDQVQKRKVKFQFYEKGKIYFRIKQLQYVKFEIPEEYTDAEKVENAMSQIQKNILKAVTELENQLEF